MEGYGRFCVSSSRNGEVTSEFSEAVGLAIEFMILENELSVNQRVGS
ncbi:MAG: hypothetical protein PHS44_06305 [Candidatus Dojkabacteria bacterium]|nr:hypothetical protein [Candidatus Dojkabacteria bacterium]